MKTKKLNFRSVMLVVAFFALSFNVVAQRDKPSSDREERIKTYKIAYITEKLNLTTDEAEKFWPVYNENEKVMQNKNKEFRKSHNINPEVVEDMTDSEAQQFISDQLTHDQEMLDLKKKFISNLEGVLPQKKIFILMEAEKQFRVDLMKRVARSPREERDPRSSPDRR